MSKFPHIVIVVPDSWRGDVIGHLGNPAAVTPNLDRMVNEDSVSFSSAFCQNPVCTPSRCSFMSGWYPHVMGHRTMYHMLHPERGQPVLLKTLKDAGYFVWWGGKNDLVPGQDGYDHFCHDRVACKGQAHPKKWNPDWRGTPDSDTYYGFYYGGFEKDPGQEYWPDSDWLNTLEAVKFIRNAPKDKPFCMFLALEHPHPPYIVEEPFYSMIDRKKLPARIRPPHDWQGKPSILRGLHETMRLDRWPEERWTDLRATYYGRCARVDHLLGMVTSALRDASIYDDSAIFFFSDHGDFAGDYGLVEKTQNTFEDCMARVPFVVKPPAFIPVKPGIRDVLVELTDFPATVEALTGISPKHTHFGRSLLPLIEGTANEHRDAVFCEGGRLHGETHCMESESTSAQNPDGLYYPRNKLQHSEGPEHTKAVMCRTKDFKYVRRLYEPDELYDLRRDPGELRNIACDPSYANTLAIMKERLLTFCLETADVVPHDPDRRW